MKKTFTCIMCPVGCTLNVKQTKDKIFVTGNGCIRGERYAIDELTSPTRMVTSLVKLKNGLCSVKTTKPVPKDKIFKVLEEISNINISEVTQGQILLKNVCGLENIDIVVTRE